MNPLILGVVLALILAVIAYFYFNRSKEVKVYHVGALKNRPNLVGDKVLVYGFVRPVYGRVVRVKGFGGDVKGRSEVLPKGGNVIEGVWDGKVLEIERVVKEVPASWNLEWINPGKVKKVNKK